MRVVIDQRGLPLRLTSPPIAGSGNRQTHNDETMHVILDRIRAAAEASLTEHFRSPLVITGP